MWSSKSSGSAEGLIPCRTAGAWALTVLSPLLVLFLVRWGAPGADSPAWRDGLLPFNYNGHGANLTAAVEAMRADPMAELRAFVLPVTCADGERSLHCNEEAFVLAAKYLGAFMLAQIAMMVVLPGGRHEGPESAGGHVPVYTKNGVLSYAISMAGFVALVSYDLVDGDVVMQLYPFMVVLLNAFALVLCLFMVVKGHTCPSHGGRDSSTSGDPVMDLYWGTELYPELFGLDVKTFTNCRFGMTAWATALVSFAYFNAKINGGALHHDSAVAMVLTVFYLGKFFLWEHGYWASMDIAHDRAGFYICWGCLVWVQTVYVSYGYYYAWQTTDSFVVAFGEENAAAASYAAIAVGVVMVYLNYEADRQRMHARSTRGAGSAWGSKYECIRADYTTDEGNARTSLLLASHLWKPARHFHYVFEILAAVSWCVPLSLGVLFPNVYWIFLTILLFDRARRDDARCFAKYGESWKRYRAEVPALVVPGLF